MDVKAVVDDGPKEKPVDNPPNWGFADFSKLNFIGPAGGPTVD